MGAVAEMIEEIRTGVPVRRHGGNGDPVASRKAFTWYSGYDATKPKGRRSAPSALVRDEDRELPPASRRAAVTATRDIQRNFAVAAWAIRRHLDYVTDFRLKVKTGDSGADKKIRAFLEKCAKKENFDVAGRHPLMEATRMAEARCIVDGDIGYMKLSSGKVQWIEGDRIRTPYCGLPGDIDAALVNHGVIINRNQGGKAIGYILCKRANTNDMGYTGQDMVFEKVIPAQWLYLHANWDLGRFDQVRGISPLLSAYNTYRDVYEGIDFALLKLKVASILALAVSRNASPEEKPLGQTGEINPPTPEGQIPPQGTMVDGGNGNNPGPTVIPEARYSVDFGLGPALMDLDPGDKAEIIESHTPSAEMQSFLPIVIGLALKSLDIPYNWYDEKYVNFSGGRQAWITYEKSAKAKRSNVKAMLHDWTEWRLQVGIDDGEIKLPKGMTPADVFDWRAAGTPWLDPLKEVLANDAAIEGGLTSPQRVIEANSDADAEEILDEQAEWLEMRKKRGMPPPVWAMSERQIVAGEQNAEKEAEIEKTEDEPATNGKAIANVRGKSRTAHNRALALMLAEERHNGDFHD